MGCSPCSHGAVQAAEPILLNQTTTIAGTGWFPILGLIRFIPAPKVRMGCFPGDTPSLKLHPWDGLWNKAAAPEQHLGK